MCRPRTVAFTLVCAVCALTVADCHAGPIAVAFDSDAEFIAYRDAGNFTKLGGGNVRHGNAAANGDWEYSVVSAGDIPLSTPSQFDWQVGDNLHTPVFSYSASGAVSLSLGLPGAPASTGGIPTGANTLLVRARANGDQNADLGDLLLTFTSDSSTYSLGTLIGDSNAQYVGLIDSRLALGFSITTSASGANINGGASPQGSLPAYQFKVGVSPVPEPSSLVLLGLGASGLCGYRLRRTFQMAV